MSPQELRRRLHSVDPDLKIIPPGRRFREKGMTKEDWDNAAGIVCRKCGKEVYRSRDGLCMPCWEAENEIEIRDTHGILNFFPQTILEQITHKAKK